jgi:hypothetical protein
MLLHLPVTWISTSSLRSFGWTEQQAFGTSKAAFMGSLVEDEEEQQILLLRATQPEVWSFFCLFHQHSWILRVSSSHFGCVICLIVKKKETTSISDLSVLGSGGARSDWCVIGQKKNKRGECLVPVVTNRWAPEGWWADGYRFRILMHLGLDVLYMNTQQFLGLYID